MGVNKDINRKLNDNIVERYNVFLGSLNNNDKVNLQLFLKEINSYGYNVLKLSDIGFIDKEDLVLVPIIEKYTSLFEDKRIRNELYTYLGFKGNTISYNFLINEFTKPNDYWDRNDPISWNFTRRWAISNSIAKLAKKEDIPELIDLIMNPNTHDDTRFIIERLGKSKDERVYVLLKSLLRDGNPSIQGGALFALAYYKNHAKEIIPLLEAFTTSEIDAHREISKKTIKKLSKND